MYYNTPENFNSFGLKVLMLSKHKNDVVSMDFVNRDRMGLADKTIFFFLFSSFVFWRNLKFQVSKLHSATELRLYVGALIP